MYAKGKKYFTLKNERASMTYVLGRYYKVSEKETITINDFKYIFFAILDAIQSRPLGCAECFLSLLNFEMVSLNQSNVLLEFSK